MLDLLLIGFDGVLVRLHEQDLLVDQIGQSLLLESGEFTGGFDRIDPVLHGRKVGALRHFGFQNHIIIDNCENPVENLLGLQGVQKQCEQEQHARRGTTRDA
ncbi:MAG: hypothetical protein BWY77_01240 [bacterium ADurb.Bin431]|nr:MAG: hypothetical protein BWY77_01240 [bacterium ADurb.Bin431]